MIRSFTLLALILTVFGFSAGVQAEPASAGPRAYELEVEQAIGDLRNSASDSRVLQQALAVASRTSFHRAAFFQEISKLSKPDLLKLSERLDVLKQSFPANPVSYGFSGGFRTVVNTLVAINIHLAIQGYESLDMIPTERLINLVGFTNVALPTMVALGLYTDLVVYFREKGMDTEYRLMRKKVMGLLGELAKKSPAELDALLAEQAQPADPAELLSKKIPGPEAPRHLRAVVKNHRELLKHWREVVELLPDAGVSDVTAVAQTGARELKEMGQEIYRHYADQVAHRDLLAEFARTLVPSEAAALKQALEAGGLVRIDIRSDAVELERRLTDRFRDTFAKYPSLTADELIRESQRVEADQQLRLGGSHTIRTAAQWSFGVTSLTALLMGAYGTLGPDVRISDFVPPLLNVNLDNVFRGLWQTPVPELFGAAIIGTWVYQAYLQRAASREEHAARRNLLPHHSWELLRAAVLKAFHGRRPEASGEEAPVSPAEKIAEAIAEPELRDKTAPVVVTPVFRYSLFARSCTAGFRALRE